MSNLPATSLLASHIVGEFADMKSDLRTIRVIRGLTIEEVADRMSCSREHIEAFEEYDSNPEISKIERYAIAIGARITIKVQLDKGIK